MGNQIHLAKDLWLPLDAVTQTFAILAIKRAGKSYCARRLAEQFLRAKQQVVIVDPKGDWWGIRSSSDGRKPGFPVVILGGERGDVPLEPGSGEVVAKLIAEERVSALLDLSLLRKYQVAAFMAVFLETLYRLKAHERYRTPMMLMIDEADAIGPQRPMKGGERMLGAAEDIVRRGGQRGIGCTIISQRSAVLNKNLLTQCEVLVALRTIGHQDLDALEAWVEKHGTPERQKILMASLPSLPTGDAWAWSPLWPGDGGIFNRVHILPIETFDSGATPKVGERRIEPRNLADVDLAALTRQMADTIERAKADDPKELRRQVADLQRQLQAAKVATPAAKTTDSEALKHEFERGATIARKAARKTLASYEKAVGVHLAKVAAAVRKAGAWVSDAITTIDGFEKPEMGLIELVAEPERPQTAAPVPKTFFLNEIHELSRPPGQEATNGHVSGVSRKILAALAEWESLGVPRAPRVLIGMMAGYSNLLSKGFQNAAGGLRSSGLISYPDPDSMSLTDQGRSATNAWPDASVFTAAELHGRIKALLGPTAGKMLDELIAVYPRPMQRVELGAKCGYGNLLSKGFQNNIGRLRTLGFVEYPSSTEAVATSLLFPRGAV